MRRFTCVPALLLLSALASLLHGSESETPPILYPFIRDGKWGYIDGSGEWVIQPRFGRCVDIF